MIFTDGSVEAKEATGWQGEWISHDLGSLPPAERELWCALGGGPHLWSPIREPARGYWTRLFLFRHAPVSQFDILRDLLGRGLTLSGPLATLALMGNDFHGHRRRPWAAAAGNLHLCAALVPGVSAAEFGLALTMLPAVAVIDAIIKISAGLLNPGIKWVNDILLSGRKVAGVLTTTQTQGDRLEYVVMGIGLNIAVAPAIPGSPFVPAVGCLREFSPTTRLSLPDVNRVVLDALARRHQEMLRHGPGLLFSAYRNASVILGREVLIWEEGLDDSTALVDWPPPLAGGIVEDIAPDLSLILADRAEPVTKGRLALAEIFEAFRG